MLWLTLATLIGLAILIGLGVWQLQRLEWKEQLIATIAARQHAPPVSLAEAIARAGRGEDIAFLRVHAEGRFDHAKEQRLFTVRDGAAGWLLITPLETDMGAAVLVDRGFVPAAVENPASRPETWRTAAVDLTGLIRLPEAPGPFTPDNDPAHGRWYWRDIDGLIRTMFPQGAAVPRFLIAAEPSGNAALPRAQAAPPSLPNRHLAYALTWFGLAGTLLAVYLAYILSGRR